MSKTKSLLLAGILGITTVALAAEYKDVLTIDSIEGKKGAVTLPHAKHVAEFKQVGGKPIVCKTCHHQLKVDTPEDKTTPRGCRTCHVKEGQAQKEHEGKKAPFLATTKNGKVSQKTVIFHSRCRVCHKAVDKERRAQGKKSKLSTCTTCHKKKKKK